MKKITSLLVALLVAVLAVGCSFGGSKDKEIPVKTQPPVVQNTPDSTDTGTQNTEDDTWSDAQNQEDTDTESNAEMEDQKQQQNSPKEFDPNSFNDEEINDLIAMLEGMVELE